MAFNINSNNHYNNHYNLIRCSRLDSFQYAYRLHFFWWTTSYTTCRLIKMTKKGWHRQRYRHSRAAKRGWKKRKNPKKKFRIFEINREYNVPHRRWTIRKFYAFKNREPVGGLKYSSDVYLEDTGPVGEKNLNEKAGKDFGGVANVGVSKGHRNQGVGTALVRKAITTARAEGKKAVILEVRKDNYKARAMYEKMGFKEVNLPPSRGANLHGKRAYYVMMAKKL